MKIIYESSYASKPVYGDTLMHWKYIKREWKNGRWVYYYDDSKYQDAKKKVSDYEAGVRYAINKNARRMDPSVSGGGVNYIISGSDGHIATKRIRKAEQALARAEKEYRKVAISTLPSRVIGKGAVKIANLLSRIMSKKKK